ncbi:hypothetical protein AAMO2058_001619100 [Amorphochlora amoebiformis]
METKTKAMVGENLVETYSPQHFRQIRRLFHVPDDFLRQNVDFSTASDFGGKGGSLLVYSKDRRYILKTVTTADQKTLLNLTEAYLDHMVKKDSMLARIFLHFHLKGSNWIAMNNWIPGKSNNSFSIVYDLKGCDDDKKLVSDNEPIKVRRSRWYSAPYRWPFCSKQCILERSIYKQGKLEARTVRVTLRREHRNKLISTLERDVEFLRSFNLMDYSLVLGILSEDVNRHDKEYKKNVWRWKGWFRGERVTFYVGIIDFLQVWNLKKRVAWVLKIRERNKSTEPPDLYACRFLQNIRRLVGLETRSGGESLNIRR